MISKQKHIELIKMQLRKKIFLYLSLLMFMGCTTNRKVVDTSVYLDSTRPVEQRVNALLRQMTLEEKIGQMEMVSEWDKETILKGVGMTLEPGLQTRNRKSATGCKNIPSKQD